MAARARHRSLILLLAAFIPSVMARSAAGHHTQEAQEAQEEKVNGAMARPRAGTPVIWRDPGAVEHLDFVGGVGGREGAPTPPFTFEEENLGGSNPKVRVTDAKGVKWSVKFGSEVNAETFSTRIAWAAGYFVEADYFVAQGKIDDVGPLTRAKKYVKPDGSFRDARFEMRTGKDVKKFEAEHSWNWLQNPFVGTKELNGLKIIMMLVSNWDNKDVRDVKRGSNTAIYQYPDGDARYLITDWGASMGKWGGYLGREKWECPGYQQQTPGFLAGVKGDVLAWGYSGQHTEDFREGIRISDLRWLLQYVGRITDDQIRTGLEASGATRVESECFTKALRARIDEMKACAAVEPDSSNSCKGR
jgi:hypothetical protein